VSDSETFNDLITRVRQGDEQAATELVRRYEPELRIMARVRLTDPSLRRAMDSMDICQSIMANFFVRAAAGQFDLETPEQLLGLLATMVRNKATDRVRREKRDRRDVRRLAKTSVEELGLQELQKTPGSMVAHRELLQMVRDRLNDKENEIAEHRLKGCSWEEISQKLGGTAEAIRKQFSRAIDRVTNELGVDESTYE
jgi:RNA polymerase sigma-70 factor (ECF subfamily)